CDAHQHRQRHAPAAEREHRTERGTYDASLLSRLRELRAVFYFESDQQGSDGKNEAEQEGDPPAPRVKGLLRQYRIDEDEDTFRDDRPHGVADTGDRGVQTAGLLPGMLSR